MLEPRCDTSLHCLTPTRNEQWIIRQFTLAAGLWADKIIIADQKSDDRTSEIARKHPLVEVIENDSNSYDELARQRMLISASRASKKSFSDKQTVLFALDADEAISSNLATSEQWLRALESPPGTVLRFRWVNILPGFTKCWIPKEPIAFGFVDDGSEHNGSQIHSRRVPWPVGAKVLDIDDVVVLHFQYVSWNRMRSKQRWYQAWEHLNFPSKRPIQLFRQYNHMYAWPKSEIQPLRSEWIDGFDKASVDFKALSSNGPTWWDMEVLGMIKRYGASKFRKIDIWDMNWELLNRQIDSSENSSSLRDPRNLLERWIHTLLRKTQVIQSTFYVRATQVALRSLGW